MSNVFISYSRKDIAFAHLLHKALEENNLESWIDWQDIPPTTEWLSEIFTAIEQADIFIFIISETSVESETCKLEINHAKLNNKRLIPIVIDEVDPSKVTEQLAAINWLFIREGDEFSRVFQDLIKAIETDYAWVKEHTRLQVRALEWLRKNKDSGCLLQGRELAAAEKWLDQSKGKEPLPTELHKEYIATARNTLLRRKRFIAGVSAVAALGIIIALLFLTTTMGFLSDQEKMAQLNSELFQAVLADDLEAVSKIINEGADVNTLDNELAPLHLAALHGRNDILAFLLSKGAIADQADARGITPLIHASSFGQTEAVELLLEAGVDVNKANAHGETALMEAVKGGHVDLISLLLINGTKVNISNTEGVYPLHVAASYGNLEAVDLLIDAGAEINIADPLGQTPICYAVMNDNETSAASMVAFLIEKDAEVNSLYQGAAIPLLLAASQENSEVVALLIEAGATIQAQQNVIREGREISGLTALHLAAATGNIDIVVQLIAAGADVNASDSYNQSPILIAARYGHKDVFESLLAADADVYLIDLDGRTALHQSARAGSPEIVAVLLEKGLNANLQENEGYTPLHYAAESGDYNVLLLLLEAGAEVNIQTKENRTPLHSAAWQGHKVIVDILIDYGAEVDAKAVMNQTPLHYAADKGNLDAVISLLDEGAQPNVMDDKGETPIQKAMSNGHSAVAALLSQYGAIE